MRKLFLTGIMGTVACLCGSWNMAFAQHSDVEIVIESGDLHIELGPEGLLFEGDFPQPPDPLAYFGDEPGFEIEDGLATPGANVGFRLLSDLLFFDGADTAAPADQIEISLGPAATIVSASSGAVDGFLFGTVDSEGGLHQDLEFALQTDDGAGGYMSGGATGAYGLHLQLTSPEYGDSQPFMIALNNGLDEEIFEEGAEALAASAGVLVPEPATLWLLAIGFCLTALTARRCRFAV